MLLNYTVICYETITRVGVPVYDIAVRIVLKVQLWIILGEPPFCVSRTSL